MEKIQIVIDKKLLLATDRAARRTKRNRSAFVRDALRQYIRRLEVWQMDLRDRRGYTAEPQTKNELNFWEAEAVWSEE